MSIDTRDAYLKNIQVQFRTNQQTLIENFSYTIPSGEVLSVLGKSGSGKSTLLHFITGIVDSEAFLCSGSIECRGRFLHKLPTEKRRVGLMMTDYMLFPHMTVRQNLIFALPHKASKEEGNDIVMNTLKKAQLHERVSFQYPHTLSGGQKARVALMRTLLSEPQILLLDEPFSRLDAEMRKDIRDFVFKEIKDSNIPALLVTHDVDDIANQQQLYKIH